jgi:hypothetical protein
MSDRKVSVIDALLAKAESTTSPEEAEALTAKAEALMVKYGIEAAVLAAKRASSKGEPEKIVKREVLFEGRYASSLVTGGYWIALAMSGGAVSGYRVKRRKNMALVLVGFEGDVDQAERLIQSLAIQAIVARDAWWKTYTYGQWLTEWEKFVEKRSFVKQFFGGAADRIKREYAVAVRESQAGEPGTAVALVDRKAAVDNHMAGLKLGKRGGDRVGGRAGGQAGHRAGLSANVGTTAVGGSRAAVGA